MQSHQPLYQVLNPMKSLHFHPLHPLQIAHPHASSLSHLPSPKPHISPSGPLEIAQILTQQLSAPHFAASSTRTDHQPSSAADQTPRQLPLPTLRASDYSSQLIRHRGGRRKS